VLLPTIALRARSSPFVPPQRSLSSLWSKERAPVEYLAGGTTLVDLMKLDVMRPARVVDLGAIAGAHDAISVSSDGVRLGAMVKMSAAADHP
jgi:xanthine dehydrogenase YagS FAD-binding subunit